MEEHRHHRNEPLSRRMRQAATDRAVTDADRIDDFVLDEDGVLDLRELDRDPIGASVADPAKALATIRGQLGNAHEVSELYDESEPTKPRWRRGLRSRQDEGADLPSTTPKPSDEAPAPVAKPMAPLSRLAMLPLDERTTAAASEPDEVPDTAVFAAGSMAEPSEPEIDLRDEGRPTADCPKCMGLGHRDLFDRFSQVEFYSCDNCMHMWQQDLS